MSKRKVVFLLVLIAAVSTGILVTLSHRRAIISGDAEVRELEREMERMAKKGEYVFDEEGELTGRGADFLRRIGELGELKKTPPWMLKRFASKRTPSLYRHMLSEIIAEQKDPAVVDTLIRVLQNKRDDECARGDAAFALGMIGDERAIEPLIKALQDESREVRINALRALGMFEDERAIEPIREFVKGGDRMEKLLAARALKGDNPNVARTLIDLAKNDSDEAVRGHALRSLGTTKDEEAFQFLIAVLRSEDASYFERDCAIEALGKMSDTRAVDILVKMLERDDEGLYLYAAEALAEIGDKRALSPIMEAIAREPSEPSRNILKKAYNKLSEK